MYALAEIIEYVRSYGLLGLLSVAVKRYIFRHERQILVELSPIEPVPDVYLMDKPALRQATLQDVEELHALLAAHHWPRTREQLRRWISGGSACVLALDQGRIVGYGCVTLQLSSRDPLLVKGIKQAIGLGDNDAWTTDAFVAPSHRTTGVYPAISQEARRMAKKLGARRLLGTVSSANVVSRKVHRKIGCREAGELTFSRFLFFTKVGYSPFT